jgi:hypothetical protein
MMLGSRGQALSGCCPARRLNLVIYRTVQDAGLRGSSEPVETTALVAASAETA